MGEERGERCSGRYETQDLLDLEEVEGCPPGEERAVEDPGQGAHVAEPDDGFVRDIGGEGLAAKPENQSQRG